MIVMELCTRCAWLSAGMYFLKGLIIRDGFDILNCKAGNSGLYFPFNSSI